jgi:hypothetical protein
MANDDMTYARMKEWMSEFEPKTTTIIIIFIV